MHFMFCFPETWQTRIFFSEARFFYLDERKNQTWQPLMTQTGRAMKKSCSETRRSITETGRLHIKLYMSICTIENFFHPAQVLFLLDLYSHCQSSLSIFNSRRGLDIVFFNIETRLKQWISQYSFYGRHCHANVWSQLILLFCYSQLRFYYANFLTDRKKVVKSQDL